MTKSWSALGRPSYRPITAASMRIVSPYTGFGKVQFWVTKTVPGPGMPMATSAFKIPVDPTRLGDEFAQTGPAGKLVVEVKRV